MPVPGSLRRRPIDEREIAELLSRQFSLPREETIAYLKLLDTSDLTLEQISEHVGVSNERASALIASMVRRGLIIEATGSPRKYAPLHPRMMLTNLFKIFEQGVVRTLREHRATVDRVVNLLTPIYEERETRMVTARER